jgi:hypothetical protein
MKELLDALLYSNFPKVLNFWKVYRTLAQEIPSSGTVREVFFNSQLQVIHQLNHPRKGDFEVDRTYIFEIGGKNKNRLQLGDLTNTWVVAHKRK